ncbi:hypothetical protein EDD21DRAFT_410158 [Dissophora ornata]|nr:hypothetical protein EDD21DRAFT_410158 [Dissophora ornata]
MLTPTILWRVGERNVRADILVYVLRGAMNTESRVTYYKIKSGLLPIELSQYDKRRKAKAMELDITVAKDLVGQKLNESKVCTAQKLSVIDLFLFTDFEINYSPDQAPADTMNNAEDCSPNLEDTISECLALQLKASRAEASEAR